MIKAVTSLFDLFNKAKTNKAYERLAILAAHQMSNRYYYIKTIEQARITLERIHSQDGEDDCQWIVSRINEYRNQIRDEEEKIFQISKNRRTMSDIERQYYKFSGESMQFYEDDEIRAVEELRRVAMTSETPIVVSLQQRNPYPLASSDNLDDDYLIPLSS